MPRAAAKKDFPTAEIRRFLEPGPIVLVSSALNGATNIMTMGWHMMMEFEPALVGCIIAPASHSHDMIRKSRECVINLPTADMAATVVRIGNSTGTEVDKFAAFGLTAAPAEKVSAPLIAECHANLECRLVDASQVRKYALFIFEVVKAHTRPRPKYPATIHYTGEGVFMISGGHKSFRRQFRPGNL